MRKIRAFLIRLGGLFNKHRRDHEFAEELESHLQMHIADNLRAGMTPQDARRQALLRLGGVEAVTESYRDRRSVPALETLWQDLRYAARTLRRSPGFTAVAVLSLALGIAANSTIFSVVSAIQFRPLPYRDADSLMAIFETREHHGPEWNMQSPVQNVLDWRRQNHVFTDIAMVAPGAGPQTLTRLGPAEMIKTQDASPNLFAVLGTAPVLGRGFEMEEVRGGSHPIILSHAFWKRRFEGNPRVLGMSLTVDGVIGTVVGVMPPGFFLLNAHDADLWFAMNPESRMYSKRNDHWLLPIARLKPGISMRQAQQEMHTIAARLAAEYPETNGGAGVVVNPLRELSGNATFLYPMMGAVGFVLLIACANLANLLMARMAARQKEMMLRASLGAGRSRLLRQLLTESLLLSFLGGALGLLITGWGIRLFRILTPQWFSGLELTTADPRVLLFTLAISMLTGVLFGLMPALSTSNVQLNEALNVAISRRSRTAISGALVVLEMALAMVLLVGAGLMLNSVLRLQSVNPGFDARNVLTMEIFLAGRHYWQPAEHLFKKVSPEATLFYQELLSRIGGLPGVQSAGMIGQLPTRYLENRTFRIEGQSAIEGQRPATGFDQVSPGFFETLRVPLKRGRYLSERDNETAPWVVVINEAVARRYIPEQEPLGKFVQLRMEPYQVQEDRPRQIVGIVGDVRHWGLRQGAPPAMYASYMQQPRLYPGGRATGHLRQNIVIRMAPGARGRTGYLADAVRRIVAELDKDQPVYQIMSMEQALADSFSAGRSYLSVLATFATMAILMAAIGIYGVISYGVSERTREIGIRMALGAEKTDVLRLVVRRGLSLTAIGIIIGAAGSLGLTRVIARFLFGLTPTDPATFVSVALLLAGVAVTASYIPARKAARLDPLKALRYE